MIFAVHYSQTIVGVEYVEADSVYEAQEAFQNESTWVPTIREIELVDARGIGVDQ